MNRLPLLLFVAFASVAKAEDVIMTHQMRVLDAAGSPVNGARTVTLHLFEASDSVTPLWSDTFEAIVENGFATVQLGTGNALPDGIAARAMFLELEVGGERLGGRQALGTVPHAARASSVDGAVQVSDLQLDADASGACSGPSDYGRIRWNGDSFQGCRPGGWSNLLMAAPGEAESTGMTRNAGMIGYFEGNCPEGWSAAGELTGRVIVATNAGGNVGATVGSALGDTAQRTITSVPAHSHTVDPVAVNSASTGAHAHTVDPPATNSGGQSNGHVHSVDPPNTSTTTTGNHSHGIATRQDDWNVSGGPGSGRPSWGEDNGPYAVRHNTQNAGNHSHTVNIGAFNSAGASADHSHSVNIGAFASASAGAHAHSVDIPATESSNTGEAAVDVTMPYIQLVGCRLD